MKLYASHAKPAINGSVDSEKYSLKSADRKWIRPPNKQIKTPSQNTGRSRSEFSLKSKSSKNSESHAKNHRKHQMLIQSNKLVVTKDENCRYKQENKYLLN